MGPGQEKHIPIPKGEDSTPEEDQPPARLPKVPRDDEENGSPLPDAPSGKVAVPSREGGGVIWIERESSKSAP